MGGLGAIYFAALVIAAAILLVVCVVGLAILRSAARAVERAGPDRPPPSLKARRVSTGLVVIAALIAISPLAAMLLIQVLLGPDALPSDTGFVALVALALGALSIAAARLLRHGPAVLLGTVGPLVLAIVAPAVIQLWVTTQTVSFAMQHRASQEQAEQRAFRYADLIDGPSAGELVDAVANAGSWHAISGGVHPFLRSDEWTRNQSPVADLSGRTVRFAVFVQCWIEDDPGTIDVSGIDFDRGLFWGVRSGACNGTMQVLVSGPVVLPDWPQDRLAAARARDRDLVSVSATPLTTDGTRATGEYAVRYVVFISADPATPVGELTRAVAEAAGTFEIR